MRKRYYSYKYCNYPVIVDGEDNDKELTLDTVVDLLNEWEWDKQSYISEHNHLNKNNVYLKGKISEVRSENNLLLQAILILIVILIIESLYLLKCVI